MSSYLIQKIFGSRNDRILKRMRGVVTQINQLEARYAALSDDELSAQTEAFKQRLAKGETIDGILPEAFAVVREAGKRVLGQRHFDVQLIGGMVMHEGNVAEMSTGEGKTLSSTLPAYLNALTGKGVHVVTVNPYLAKRDAEWMGGLFHFLGLTTGVILPDLSADERRQAYNCDISYGTNNEFGFDYLRDNMVMRSEDKVQRDLYFAIVDEVDSILIDESRTPLIISGQVEESSELYAATDQLVKQLNVCTNPDDLTQGDFTLNEKEKQVTLTESGHERAEKLMRQAGLLAEGTGLYDLSNIGLLHYLNASLRANFIYKKDVEYVVADGQVVIIDEHTGRAMSGRRWSDGLHQAIEAKEKQAIQNENQTLASITFQNYFRLYNKLAGMTGTADTEAFELHQIYGLEVAVVPTNKQMVRKDSADLIYLTQKEKYHAVVEDIKTRHQQKQPILVGTTSIENSEYLSDFLKKEGIPHQVLNAKYHEQEAHIIEQAGSLGAVTIATNMAGRGTDIVLGGGVEASSEEGAANTTVEKPVWQAYHSAVLAVGGLHVLGTERHESRRIDNQLRGRSGRQGDPGSSQFYLSLEDNLMRVFASDKVAGIMRRLGMEENDTVQHPWLTRAIESTQRKVEGHYFDVRKQLLSYDDVVNDQRKIIYQQRNELMSLEDISETIEDMRGTAVASVLHTYLPEEAVGEDWDVTGFKAHLLRHYGLQLRENLFEVQSIERDDILQAVLTQLTEAYQVKSQQVGDEIMRQLEKAVMLQALDALWKEHLAAIDHLRQGIHFRGYAQKNPAQEFKREAYELFKELLDNLRIAVTKQLALVQIEAPAAAEPIEEQQLPTYAPQSVSYRHEAMADERSRGEHEREGDVATVVREQPKVGRNEACPCGSGSKYKHCHGQL